MPMLVHIADEKKSARILRSGIKAGDRGGVFCMPVVRDFLVTHQWIREVRKGGPNVVVGVRFRLPAATPVWAGHYRLPHQRVSLGHAIAEVESMSDPLGFEVFVEGHVSARQITDIRTLPQGVGWRHFPHAHGQRPCGHECCLERGEYGARSLREHDEEEISVAEAFDLILHSDDSEQITVALWRLGSRRRRMNPSFTRRLLALKDEQVLVTLAIQLAHFRHPATRGLLRDLCRSRFEDVRLYAASSARDIHGPEAIRLMADVAHDPIVRRGLTEELE